MLSSLVKFKSVPVLKLTARNTPPAEIEKIFKKWVNTNDKTTLWLVRVAFDGTNVINAFLQLIHSRTWVNVSLWDCSGESYAIAAQAAIQNSQNVQFRRCHIYKSFFSSLPNTTHPTNHSLPLINKLSLECIDWNEQNTTALFVALSTCNITKLVLLDNTRLINDSILAILVQALRKSRITYLRMSFYRLFENQWSDLLGAIKNLNSIQHLDLTVSEAFSSTFMRPLTEKLLVPSTPTNLQSLSLCGVDLDELYMLMSALQMNTTIQCLELHFIFMNGDHLLELARLVQTNNTLKHIRNTGRIGRINNYSNSDNDAGGESNTNNNNVDAEKTKYAAQLIIDALRDCQNRMLEEISIPNFYSYMEYNAQINFYTKLNRAGRYNDFNGCDGSNNDNNGKNNVASAGIWPFLLARVNRYDTTFINSGGFCMDTKATKEKILQDQGSIIYWFLRHGAILFPS